MNFVATARNSNLSGLPAIHGGLALCVPIYNGAAATGLR